MPRVLAGAVVFAASAAVLVLEIAALRLVAPYIGLTIETSTAVIGVVLAGIALGAWWGGRLADRLDPRLLLGPLLVLGGLLALASVPLVTLVGDALRGGGRAAGVVIALVGFFWPAVALSAVTPTVTKLQLGTLRETGSVVGRLSALATAGAIAGTFVTGFLLVATLPTRTIVLGVGVVLVVLGGALWAWLRTVGRAAAASVLALAVPLGGLAVAVPDPCQTHTTYYCASVVPDPARPSGRTLVLDALHHSYVDLSDPTHLEFRYVRVFAHVLEALAPPPRPLRALHVGGGGVTFPRYLAATRPGTRSVVLELDPALVRLDRRALGLETGPALRVVTGDARTSLGDQPTRSYDLAVGDAFGGVAVPWHLTTREFVAEIKRRLRPDGVYLLNVIDRPPMGFARAELATLRAVFRHVAAVAPPEVLRVLGGNVVLVAADRPLDTAALARRAALDGEGEEVLTGEALDRFVAGARVLRDDFAPVDTLLTPFRP